MTSTEIAAATNIMLGTTQAQAMYIGSTLLWQAQVTPVNRLPQGYTELEYIESTSTGSQYIDLNIKLYETLGTQYDIAIKFYCVGAGSDNTQPTLFGCQTASSPYPGTFIRKNASGNYVQGRYIGGSNKDNNIGNTGEIIELPVQTSPNKNVYNINNQSTTHSFGTSLFCAFSDTNNTPYRYTAAKLYYFKLFVEGTLVRDMIPCTDPNNVVGLYDAANNVFYSSPNGAAFTAGPAV